MDQYDKMAYDYDQFGAIEQVDPKEQQFFRQLFEQYGVKSVLDCACGTGKHLYIFHQLGVKTHGSDISSAMLEVAKENLGRNGISMPLIPCDFMKLEDKLKGTYDALVCLSTSLPHLHTDEELLTALLSMKGRLNAHGILVLTQGTSHFNLYHSEPVETVVNNRDFSRVFIKNHDEQFLTIQILDLFHSESRNESNCYEMKYRILLDHDYERLLKQAGFEHIRIYGNFEFGEYTKESRRLIVVAQKGAEPPKVADPLKEYKDPDGRINRYPAKHALKALVLDFAAGHFETGVEYTEQEVNAILDAVHSFDDICLLRRELYEQGYLGRERDGSRYWLIEGRK